MADRVSEMTVPDGMLLSSITDVQAHRFGRNQRIGFNGMSGINLPNNVGEDVIESGGGICTVRIAYVVHVGKL